MLPGRVVSLVPSLTELVWWLGEGHRLVGRTRFCDAPPEGTRIEAMGGTKDPDVARVLALRPDLVLANREENRREDVEALRQAGVEVLLTDPVTVAGAAAMVGEIARRLGPEERGARLVSDIEEAAGEILEPRARPRVFVAVWKQPLLGLGSEAYGHDLLEVAGAENVLAARPRYPELTFDDLRALAPDLILLPDEPYRFRETDRRAFSQIAPARLVDGRILWWYGPRIPAAIRTLRALFAEAQAESASRDGSRE
ncbi:MAG: helical backbone metal receptor [Dehalococcoidia bacterium]